MVKSPCTSNRVLDGELCPPFGVSHDPAQYPEYYNPLYYPNLDMNRNIFMNPLSIAFWLERTILEHHIVCMCCKSHYANSVSECSVHYASMGAFRVIVFARDGHIRFTGFTLREMASSAFTICKILNCLLCDISHDAAVSNFHIMLRNVPQWIYTFEMYLADRLHFLLLSDLISVSIELGSGRKPRSKKSAVDFIVDHVRRECEFIMGLEDEDDWSTFCQSNPHFLTQFPPQCRALCVATYFNKIYSNSSVLNCLQSPPFILCADVETALFPV